MNFLDIIIAIPLLWAVYKGFRKGLVIEIASLAALILGIYGGIHFSDAVADFLKERFNWNSTYMPLISFTITFLGIVILVHLVGKVVERIVNIVALGIVNKILGAAFGFLKVAFILSVILIIFDGFDAKMNLIDKDKKEKSMLYKPLRSFAVTVIPKLNFEEINRTLDMAPSMEDESSSNENSYPTDTINN